MQVTSNSGVTLDTSDHSYWRGRERIEWPSLTGIIDDCNMRYSPGNAIPAATWEWAGHRGTMVHEALALLANDELDYGSLDERILPYVDSWLEMTDSLEVESISTELSLLHPTMRYCCTLDMLCRWNGDPAIVDYKSSSKMLEGNGDQLAGQKLALMVDGQDLPKWWVWKDVKLIGVHLRPGKLAMPTEYSWRKHKEIFESTAKVWWARYLRGTTI